ncbi:MAG: hypothetical protein AABO58_09665 [Acidobacteriota bacterium]
MLQPVIHQLLFGTLPRRTISALFFVGTFLIGARFALAQTPEVAPPAAASAARVAAARVADVSQAPVADAEVEEYFRNKVAIAHAGKGVALKAVHRTPAADVVVAEIQNEWLTYAVRVRSSDALADAHNAPAIGSEAVDAAVSSFVRLKPVDRIRLGATLRTFGMTLSDVYAAPTAPYFNNGRGLVFNRRDRRFLLVVRGVRDRSSNTCFKAAIDISTADVLSNASMPCTLE